MKPVNILLIAVTSLLIVGFPLHAEPVAGATGYFHPEQQKGRWWLVDPQGQRFLVQGVDTVTFQQDFIQGTAISPYGNAVRQKYGSLANWRVAVGSRLLDWNFNTLGDWSDSMISKAATGSKPLYYTPGIDFGAQFVGQKMKGAPKNSFADVFDPSFRAFAEQLAFKRCHPLQNDPLLLGWYTDNELDWGWEGWKKNDASLLVKFLAMAPDAPGHLAAVRLLQGKYASISEFNRAWKTHFQSWSEMAAAHFIGFPAADPVSQPGHLSSPNPAALADCQAFAGAIAEQYFLITGAALQAADPHHLNLGCRFATFPSAPVVAAAAKYVDVISFNCYALDPRPTIDRYAAFGKPVMIGEFSFRSADAGLPNTKGAGPKVKTQSERAVAMASYVQWALSRPSVVGYNWFEHADEPKLGRFDGENSNYGLVNTNDQPYEPLVDKFREINGRSDILHSQMSP